MRLHEAAPKLIIQERLGDKVKVSSYWPVPELTRAELALGRLHIATLSKLTVSLNTLSFLLNIVKLIRLGLCLQGLDCK